MKKLLLFFALVCAPAGLWAQNLGGNYPFVQPEFFGGDGKNPCAGCTLFSYAAGTTTPAATYADNLLTIPNTNPIILNSSGRPSGSNGIYLTAISYKFILLDTKGATVWTRDNVYDLAQIANGGSVGCLTGGTTLDARISHAYSLLPTTGGIIDCTNLTTAQILSSDPFTGMSIPVTVIMPIVQSTSSVALNVPSNVTLLFPEGASLSNANTTTIKGAMNAGLTQIFTGIGLVNFGTNVTSIFPQWWGAKGDGVTNDSPAFQLAFNAAWASGVPVIMTPTVFVLASNVTLPSGLNNTFQLQGSGKFHIGGTLGSPRKGTVIHCTMIASDCISLTSSVASEAVYNFRDFSMAGPDTQLTMTSGSAIKILATGSNVPQVYMDNMDIELFQGASTAGVWLSNVENGSLKDVDISFVNECAELANGYNANSWYNVTCQLALNDGVHISGSTTWSMFGGMFQSNKKTGLHLDGLSQSAIVGVHFENNNSSATGGEGAIKLTSTAASAGNFHITIQSCNFGGSHDKIIGSGGDATYNNSFNMLISDYTATVGNPVLTLGAHDTGWIIENSAMGPANVSDTLNGTMYIDRLVTQFPQQGFASLASCSATTLGQFAFIVDSTTTTWGNTVTGGGANPIMTLCDGTNWTVVGK